MYRACQLAVAVVCLLALQFTPALAQRHRSSHSSGYGRPYYGGGHHTESHGGRYPGGHGSSHKGGHYVNPRTHNHYGRHK